MRWWLGASRRIWADSRTNGSGDRRMVPRLRKIMEIGWPAGWPLGVGLWRHGKRDDKLCLGQAQWSETGSAVRRASADMRRTQGLISFVHWRRAGLLLFHLLCTCVPLSQIPSHMGRATTKSVARVYADVNSKLGSSWYEYGRVKSLSLHAFRALRSA